MLSGNAGVRPPRDGQTCRSRRSPRRGHPQRCTAQTPRGPGWALGGTPIMRAPPRSSGVAGPRPPPTPSPPRAQPQPAQPSSRPPGCRVGALCPPGGRVAGLASAHRVPGAPHPRGDSRRGHRHRRRSRFPRHGPFRAQWPRSGWPRPLPKPGTCRKRALGPFSAVSPHNRGQRLTRKTGNL